VTKIQDDRKQIMARIRSALIVLAPKTGAHHGEKPTLGRDDVTATPPLEQEQSPTDKPAEAQRVFTNQLPIINNGGVPGFQQWLPPVGEDWDSQAALFAANSAELKTEFHLCENETDLQEKLAALKTECGWSRVASHHGELTARVLSSLQLPCVYSDDGYDVIEMEKCDVGITECEALVAQTGSVLVTNRSSGGRVLSVLPPHHVAIARREQMLPDLSAAFALMQAKYSTDYPTMISFITGPSRTGDIERILVLGAHGPKRLTVFCV
jgi:L-lactate dehydrogenase complex protein LldG